MVGDLMQSGGDAEAARAAYSHPKPGSVEYAAAQAKLAWTYQAADDKETALKLARAAAASGDSDARVTLADLLRADELYPEAAQVLSGLIAESKTPDWRLLYSRGVAYERMNRWPEGQADLQAALAARPDEPELLNYLGYSWIDRGEHLKDALAMVQKAVAADPRSGAMVDSLGWAYYRMGDYKQAVEKLEQAVELEAGDPEINNHLGDAYWKVGRRDEAQFQWRRVLTLKPDDKIKLSAETKLASGLGPDGAAPKVAASSHGADRVRPGQGQPFPARRCARRGCAGRGRLPSDLQPDGLRRHRRPGLDLRGRGAGPARGGALRPGSGGGRATTWSCAPPGR